MQPSTDSKLLENSLETRNNTEYMGDIWGNLAQDVISNNNFIITNYFKDIICLGSQDPPFKIVLVKS